ncbi:MAG: hypothetical protein ABWK15_09055 [Dissulfuribacterales bacterium]
MDVPVSEAKTASPRMFDRAFAKDDIDLIFSLFSGQRFAFAEEMPNAGIGEVQVLHRPEPLTNDVLIQHLQGRRSLWFYPIQEDMRVSFLILRYFIGDAAREFMATQLAAMRSSGLHHLISLSNAGLNAYIEQHGAKSLRLWLFLHNPVHFLKAMEMARRMVNALPLPKSGVHLIAQRFTEPAGLNWQESAIAMPLGKEMASGMRRFFLTHEDGRPAADQMAFLRRIKANDWAQIKAFCEKSVCYDVCRPQPRLNANKIEMLFFSCAVLKRIAAHVEEGRKLSEEVKRVLYYTVGFLSHQELHEILSHCPDYREKTVNRQLANLHPRPISCARVRELLPSLVAEVDCHCIFDSKELRLGRYPSPLLHVQPELVPPLDKRYSAQYATPRELCLKWIGSFQELESMKTRIALLEQEIGVALKASRRPFVEINGFRFEINEGGCLAIKAV